MNHQVKLGRKMTERSTITMVSEQHEMTQSKATSKQSNHVQPHLSHPTKFKEC
jgi:hypothetical protein